MTSSRRSLLASALALTATLPSPALAQSALILNDASELDATPVARHVTITPSPETAMIAQLRAELRAAAAAGRPVCMGVARHSMGGQSLAQDSTAFTFATPVCVPDIAGKTYHVQAGTRWRDVIRTLDPLGFSPAVMQAYNDFGVASAFSVNSHGWPVAHGPFGTTVRALRLMLADGTILTCSATQNTDLFRHAMGGYGLFGIIIDLEIEMVPNLLLRPAFEICDPTRFAERFLAVCKEPATNMAYGRLDVSREGFFESAMLISFHPLPTPPAALAQRYYGSAVTTLTRDIYRAEIKSDLAKRFRWFMETHVESHLEGGAVTRNTILNAPVKSLASHDPARTDILHEYFLPPENLADFFSACRRIIPHAQQNLLNVTLRFVASDRTSILAYAPSPRIAAVMSFSQAKTAAAETDMQQLTRSLIDSTLALGGSFYLPYRLHARPDQVMAAYPALAEFIACKKHYDPTLLFRNALWTNSFM